MQCIWTSTNNVLRNQQLRRCLPHVSTSSPLIPSKNFHGFQLGAARHARRSEKRRGLSPIAHAFLSTVVRDTSTPPAPFLVTEGPHEDENQNAAGATNQSSFTAAQISRIAAQSVRLACQGPSTREAFLIVQSLQASVAHYNKSWYPGKPFRQKVAIDFGRAVSPRLAIHSLLHGLVRRGLTKKAGDVARQIVTHHPTMRLSGRTTQLIMTELCRTDAAELKDKDLHAKLQKAKSELGDYLSRPENITDKRIQMPCTRIAIHLFLSAKQYRQHRAKQMFQQLIDACLLQGEILVICFLFAFLVKQWQSRLANTTATDDSFSFSSAEKPTASSNTPLRPRGTFLSQTLACIMPVLFGDVLPNPKAIRPTREEAVQALAVLAGMLYEDLLPSGHIGPLVKSLVVFSPSASVEVWTRRKGKKDKWERRDAREYFDEVLDHVLSKATSKRYIDRATKLETYNNLLLYSLHRKASPESAEQVIQRMHQLGGDVAPNITTFNIVLRASTNLRRHDMSEKILEFLRRRPENHGHGITYTPPDRPDLPKQNKVPTRLIETTSTPVADNSVKDSIPVIPEAILSLLSPAIRRILLEDIDLDCLSELDRSLPADGDTLSAYIDFLTASGRPDAAVKLIKILLPELRYASYSPIHPESRRLGRRRQRLKRRLAVSRALGLGPIFFTSALNALVKAGKTGLAERTWRLAKAAESTSWDPKLESRPWILPCAAYTTMIQCYAMEARKACSVDLHRGGLHQKKSERQIMGWGTTPVIKRLVQGQSLSLLEVSRDMGLHIFRLRQISEDAYRARLTSYLQNGGSVEDRRTIHPPKADERFFNAALDLFGRLPGTYVRRRRRAKPYRWRRLERRQFDRFARCGCVQFLQDSRLLAVLLAMREAGFEIPQAYRHLLVGIDIRPPLKPERPLSARRQIYAHFYRAADRPDPTRLATSKDRGLPIRRCLRIVRTWTP